MFASFLYFLQILANPALKALRTLKDPKSKKREIHAPDSFNHIDDAFFTFKIDAHVQNEIHGLEAYLNHALENIKSIKRATSYVQPISIKSNCHDDEEIEFKKCRGLYSDEKWNKWKLAALVKISEIKNNGVKRIHSLVSNLTKDLKAKKDRLSLHFYAEVPKEWRKIHEIVKKTIGEMMNYILFGMYNVMTLISITYKPLDKPNHRVSQPVCRVPVLLIQPHKHVDNFLDVCKESIKKQAHLSKVVKVFQKSIEWTVDDFRVYLNQKQKNKNDELQLGAVSERAHAAATKALKEYCNRTEKEITHLFTADHHYSVLLKKCFDDFVKILEGVRKTVMTELLAVSALFIYFFVSYFGSNFFSLVVVPQFHRILYAWP